MPESIIPAAISSQLDNTGEERIHVANRTTVVRAAYVAPVPAVNPMYLGIDNVLYIQRSTDALTFPTQVSTGLTTSTSICTVHAAGGRLYHLGSGTEGRTTTDGTNWVACTGLSATSGVNPGTGVMLKVGTEWQLYHYGLHVSTDGVAFSLRSVPSGGLMGPAYDGNTTIIAMLGGRFLQVSTNSGSTWSFYNASTNFHSEESIQLLLAIPGVGFRAFGRNTSGNLLIGSSATGLSGSWTTTAGPATAVAHGVARDPTSGRIMMVLQTGATWYSDNNGTTWSAGGTIPYGGAGAYPASYVSMIYANGAYYFCAAQGGGFNAVYRSVDGVSWSQVFSLSGGNAVESIAEFAPA